MLQVALACHVPKELQESKELTAKEWFETVTKAMGGEVEIKEETEEVIIGICHASREKELFALKMRDAGSSAGYQMLLKKGLIPQDGVSSPNICCEAGGMHAKGPLIRARLHNYWLHYLPYQAAESTYRTLTTEIHADSSDDDYIPDPEAAGIDPW
jgi:hypothetical protein